MEKEFIITDREKQRKTKIFEIFSKLRYNESSDREKDMKMLADKIFRWCWEYSFSKKDKLYGETGAEIETKDEPNFPLHEANIMGLEILKVVYYGLFDKEGKYKENLNMSDGEEGFFRYLRGALNVARLKAINDIVQNEMKDYIAGWKRRKLKKIRQYLEVLEQNKRGLSEEEKIQHLCIYFDITKKQARRNLELLNSNISSLDFGNYGDTDDNSFNRLNTEETKLFDGRDASIDPEDEFIEKVKAQDLRDAVKKILEKKQNRTRELCRDLFTFRCIKKEVKNFEILRQILSEDIITAYKGDGDNLTEAKIYMKYHPNVTNKKSAEAMASTRYREFRNTVKKELENNL